ncbi:uncharacterized protein LOC124446913 [Xenia sp. Carnegie-2017]|uniref:uncharacterized protein LOC124446913 n=1 Tax=Xenia sp. Carnegie-2017 TaxID=2897299 RepID=UPI001F043862|nr:uncharacterized protein LOC124446913 [Xenia sp. Carnegie-2017]
MKKLQLQQKALTDNTKSNTVLLSTTTSTLFVTESTEEPTVTTGTPVKSTSTPFVTESTEEPTVTTGTPEKSTSTPFVIESTEEPTVTTGTPEKSTSTPFVIESTKEPTVTTGTPEKSTSTPFVTESTEEQTVTTGTPVKSTSTPFVTESTEEPTVTTGTPKKSTSTLLHYVNVKVQNDYGNDVDVRTNSEIFDDFVVEEGSQFEVNRTSFSDVPFILRVFDRRDGIPVIIDENNYVVIHPTVSKDYIYKILVKPGEKKFYVVFLIVNNHGDDIVVSTELPGSSGEIPIKTGTTFVVSEQPSNDNPIAVTAIDSKSSRELNINGERSVEIKPSSMFGASFQVLFVGTVIPAPTFAPGTKVYFVSFIISNTYGYNINLKSNLRNPFNDLVIINGQTVSLEVKVSNAEPIMFEAFVPEIGETIKINGVIKYNLRPKENSGNFTILSLEENPALFKPQPTSLKTTPVIAKTTGTPDVKEKYFVNVTIVNEHHGQIRVITTHPQYGLFDMNKNERFHIVYESDTYSEFYITAFHNFQTITINGTASALISSTTSSIPLIYYVPEFNESAIVSTTVIIETKPTSTTSTEKSKAPVVGPGVTEPTNTTTFESTDAPSEKNTSTPFVTESTKEPTVTTGTPEKSTSTPFVTESTKQPTVTTGTPEKSTSTPFVTERTEEPTITTGTPEKSTSTPFVTESTEEPTVTTGTPVKSSSTPFVTESTEEPTVTTGTPVKSTSTPFVTKSTEKPTVTTGTPEKSTSTPFVTKSTEKPTVTTVQNDYGNDVDVRTNSEIFDDFVVEEGSQFEVNRTSFSDVPFILRVFDRRDGIPVMIDDNNYVVIHPTVSKDYIYKILVKPGEKKFYVVFLIVNNHGDDIVVSTELPGSSGEIPIKTGTTFVVSEQPSNDNPIAVTAIDSKSSRELNINGERSVEIKPSSMFGASFQVLFVGTVIPAPTFAPGTKVYFVSFIISNTYGYNINLKSNLRNPFNDLVIINGQTVSLEVKVSNAEPIMFEAFVPEIGETIKINGVIKYNLPPKENSGNFTILNLEENPALFKPQPTSIKTTPGKKSIVSVQNLAFRETSRRLDTMIAKTTGTPDVKEKYFVNVTIVNEHHGQIRVITTHPQYGLFDMNKNERFHIVYESDTYSEFYITAFHNFQTITINGTASALISSTTSIQNDYGNDVDVRTNSEIFDDFVVEEGSQFEVNRTSFSDVPFILRVFDRRDGIPVIIDENNYVVIHPTVSKDYIYKILVKPGEKKFYVVFLIVNNHGDDIVVSTELPGSSGEIPIKTAPTFAPGTKVYFVSFIISNTYGYNINLKSNLRNPFNDLVIINGQTVSLEVKVSNAEPIMFEAFVPEIGETIKINGVIKYNLRPKENSGNFTVLTLEENPALVKPQPTSIKTTPGKKFIVSVQNLAYPETSRRLDTSKMSDVMSDVKYLIFERS